MARPLPFLGLVLFPALLHSCSGQIVPRTSRSTCPNVRACQDNGPCAVCLMSLTPYTGTGITFNKSVSGPLQVRFYENLVSACASTDVGMLVRALDEVTKSTHGFEECQRLTNFAVAPCQAASVQCFANPTCQACLTSIYNTTDDRGPLLDGPSCMATDPNLLRTLAAGTTADAGAKGDGWCYNFPRCSFNKRMCRSTQCASCLALLAIGNVAAAVRGCDTGSARRDLDSVMSSCTVSNLGGEYWSTRCNRMDLCRRCLRDMGGSPLTKAGILQGYQHQTCRQAFENGTAVAILKNLVYFAPQNYAYDCAVEALYCIAEDPLCAPCLYNGTTGSNTTGQAVCNALLNASNYIVTRSCLPCPESVFTINKLVVATTVVGSVSMAACILVVLTILAHGHDRISIRFRIIIGLMMANALYSYANAMPLDQLDTSKLNCGQLHLPFETIRYGRALWLFGKYSLVCFEIFVLGASIWALQPENGAMSARCEALFHLLSILGGLVAFVGFYVRCDEINRSKYNSEEEAQALSFDYSHLNIDDNMDDVSDHNEAVVRFSDGRMEYDELEQRMLQVWIGMLGIAIIMWVMLRLAYNRVITQWRNLLSESVRAAVEDEWLATRRSTWKLRSSILQLQRNAYDAVARPLEPYVAVFMVFAAPAIVMSTDWCQTNSRANTADVSSISSFSYGTCDAWCEFALAWRSFATVLVFSSSRKRRAELMNIPKTIRLLYGRIIGGCTRSSRRHESIELVAFSNGKGVPTQTSVKWQIEASEISFGEKLADGSYGVVWTGQWSRRPEAVAIKVLKALAVDEDGDILDEWALEDFHKECMMLQQLEHPNLLKFHGCGQTDEGRGFLVTELCGAGSLRAVLADNTVRLTWATRISIARDLATGLAHLHSIPIVHRDLKSDNCLLTDQDGVLTAKVADFGGSQLFRPAQPSVVYSAFTGIARRVDDLPMADLGGAIQSVRLGIEGANGKMTTAVGTLHWMAPELVRGDQVYGQSVDVYSFGIILWELATRKDVWDELHAKSYMDEVSLVTQALKSGRRPTIPEMVETEHPLFVTLMRMCWAGDPVDRPEFGAVKEFLERCAQSANTNRGCVERVEDSESSSLTRPLLQNAW